MSIQAHTPIAASVPAHDPMQIPGVLIVDDHPLMRQGIRLALRSCPEFTIVGEAGTGENADGGSDKCKSRLGSH